MTSRTFLEAIRDAQHEEMARDPRVFIMGEDVRSNLFGTTSGLMSEFGEGRVIDTPIAEAGITGVAAGAAMVGMRPIVDYTIAPFLYPAMDQIISIVAKSRYLYGGQAKVPVVLRANMIYGAGNSAQHSDRPYSMFMHMPGLKIIVPSSAHDMKGLLKTAIRDEDPVMSFEDVALWTSRSDIPDEEYLIPFGKADIKRAGTDCTIVAIGAMVRLALQAADVMAKDGVSVEVLDPRTLSPLDDAAILESVKKTGRLLVVDCGFSRCGVASEISAIVAERAFGDLKAPILRVTTPDTHIPFSPPLERQLFPTAEKVISAVRRIMGGDA